MGQTRENPLQQRQRTHLITKVSDFTSFRCFSGGTSDAYTNSSEFPGSSSQSLNSTPLLLEYNPRALHSLLNSRHHISGWSEMSVPSLCRLASQKVATLKAEHVGHIFTYAGKVPPYLLLGLGPVTGKKGGVKLGNLWKFWDDVGLYGTEVILFVAKVCRSDWGRWLNMTLSYSFYLG